MTEISPHSGRTFSTTSWAVLGVTLIACLQGGCFDGLSAKGLGCEGPDDCGPMLTCDMQTGCCGGECLFPDDTDTTTGTSTNTASTTGSTTTDTSTTATTEVTETTGGIVCGDGQVDEEEECDPGSPDVDTRECDSDCTRPICGDGHLNGEAGEIEDDLTRGAEKVECVLFGADAEQLGDGGFGDVWATGTLVYDHGETPPVLTPWDDYHATPPPEPRWRFASGSGDPYWGSGLYQGCVNPQSGQDCPGTLVWMQNERCIPLPAEIEGVPTHLSVAYEHAAGFGVGPDFGADGGRAWVLYYDNADCNGMPVMQPLVPPDDRLACDCYDTGAAKGTPVCESPACPSCMAGDCATAECYSLGDSDGPNPGAGQPAILNQTRMTSTVQRPHVSQAIGDARAIRLRFEATYSCRRDPGSMDDAWRVFGASVKLRDGAPPSP